MTEQKRYSQKYSDKYTDKYVKKPQNLYDNKAHSFLRQTTSWKTQLDSHNDQYSKYILPEKNQKNSNRQFLRHTINYDRTNLYPLHNDDEQNNTYLQHPNRQKKNYRNSGNFNTQQYSQKPKSDFLSRYQQFKEKKIKSYTQIQEQTIDTPTIPTNSKLTHSRFQTETEPYFDSHKKLKEKYSYNDPKEATNKFTKKNTYHYYTPKDTQQSYTDRDQRAVSPFRAKYQPEVQQKNKGKYLYQKSTNFSASRISRQVKLAEPKINDFTLGKCLGEGKFGNVYMAIHKDTGSIFALKKVKKQQIKQHNLEKQFMMEIKMQLYFNNENLLKLYGFFDDTNYIYLILEYMEEGTLFSYMKKQKTLSEADTSHRLRQILKGLVYLHEKKIAHRDLKPQNIVISNGVCKICDFGWAAICQDRRKTLVGTIDYAPPDVLKGQQYDGVANDLWCLGVLCYQLLIGKTPFYHTRVKETMMKIINVGSDELPMMERLSPIARDFIKKLIVKQSDERMTSQDAIKHDFIVKLSQDEQQYMTNNSPNKKN